MNRWGLRLLRWLLGGIFLAAGAMKVLDPASFAQDIAHYRLLPQASIHLVAITLPWIEILAGGLLLAGVWQRANAALIALLMLVFMLAIGTALARGLDVNCGCFGTAQGRKAGLTTLVQDVAILLAAAWLWWRSQPSKEKP